MFHGFRPMPLMGVLFALALSVFSVAAQDKLGSPDDIFRAQLIPRGSKVFIAPFKSEGAKESAGGGFESYIAAALRKKEVPVLMVTDPASADFVIEGSADKRGAGWAKKIFAGDYHDSTSASLTVTNKKTGVVAYADSSDRASAARGYRSSAEKLAKYLKKKIEDDEKKLAKLAR